MSLFDSADQNDFADSLGAHPCNCDCHRKGKIAEKWAVRFFKRKRRQFYRLNSTKAMRQSQGKTRTTAFLRAELMYSTLTL